MENSTYYIGLMSGTSLDGIDGALVQFSGSNVEVLKHVELPYSDQLKQKCFVLFEPTFNEIEQLQCVAFERAELAAQAVSQLCVDIPKAQIKAIADHGQTVRHNPNANPPYTLQIHHGARLCELTGISTVVDFRSKDIASGGQGAPLVPAFHQAYFSGAEQYRAIINIGGIANVSLVFPDKSAQPFGFDTGPGNTLLDLWCQQHTGKPFDESGAWAATGSVNSALLEYLMSDEYFGQTAPKSTGREYFNLAWLDQKLSENLFKSLQPNDIQATLTQFTATSILLGVRHACSTRNINLSDDLQGLYICGGGASNQLLMDILQLKAAVTVQTTQVLGVGVKQVEAAAFAWLGKQCIERRAIDMSATTGSKHDNILGAIYSA